MSLLGRFDKYRRYNASEKGKARIQRYRTTMKGITTRAKHDTNSNANRRGAK